MKVKDASGQGSVPKFWEQAGGHGGTPPDSP